MSARVDVRDFTNFAAALRALPEELAREAEGIVVDHAMEAQREIETGYPLGPTGHLKRGVKLDISKSRFGTIATVRSTARHVYIFELGTGPRQTRSGANRGQMPPAPDAERMIPKVVRIRARMQQALIELVKRAGFEVSSS